MLEIETLPEEIGFLRAFFNQKNTADPKHKKCCSKECPVLLAYLQLASLRHWLTTVIVGYFFFLTWSIGNQKKKKEKENVKDLITLQLKRH